MAKKAQAMEAAAGSAEARPGIAAYVPVVVGWIVPGGGHFYLRRWGRGALLLASVGIMFFLGLAMYGKLYTPKASDIVDTLAWMANIGAGGFYLGAKFFGYSVPEPQSAVGDYGTKFLLVAGLLNMLVMLDAWDIAIGKKE